MRMVMSMLTMMVMMMMVMAMAMVMVVMRLLVVVMVTVMMMMNGWWALVPSPLFESRASHCTWSWWAGCAQWTIGRSQMSLAMYELVAGGVNKLVPPKWGNT